MAPSTLNVALQNQTTSSSVYAYITGTAISNNALFLLQADGESAYYPSNPPAIGTPLAVNCAIALGAPGATRTVTIPQIAGGRVWFSIGTPLTFLLNPGTAGPGLVTPSPTNSTDPNIKIFWDFCEFTFNSDQLFANISYVDFVSIPIALTLTNTSGATQTVTGIPPSGLNTICAGLIAQTAASGHPWSSLIVKNSAGQNLRVLSPNNGIVGNPSLFSGLFEPYVDSVWAKYTSAPLSVNSQASFGTLAGRVSNTELYFADQAFAKPSTADIFSCSTGPFAPGVSAERDAIIPRLAASFNRTTLLETSTVPAPLSLYYKSLPTNHYARIVHAANIDGLGYAFPYDDVTPDAAPDQSGKVTDPNPQLWTIAVGGAQYAGRTGAGSTAPLSAIALTPAHGVVGPKTGQPPPAAQKPMTETKAPASKPQTEPQPKPSLFKRLFSRFQKK